MNLPEFLGNPSSSYSFTTWLRRFIEDNLPVWVRTGSNGGIQLVTSDDASVTVTDPAGPTVDLSVSLPDVSDAVRFNNANTSLVSRFLHFILNDSDDDGYGLHVQDQTGDLGTLFESEQPFEIRAENSTGAKFDGDAITFDTSLTAGSRDVLFVGTGVLDTGAQRITNGADGVNPTDFATVEQLTAGTVETVTSGDGSITVTNPSGPTVDLSVAVVDGGGP